MLYVVIVWFWSQILKDLALILRCHHSHLVHAPFHCSRPILIKYSGVSHTLTLTWLDFYCAVSLYAVQRSELSVWRHCRNWIRWLSRYERLYCNYNYIGPITYFFINLQSRRDLMTAKKNYATTRWRIKRLMLLYLPKTFTVLPAEVSAINSLTAILNDERNQWW